GPQTPGTVAHPAADRGQTRNNLYSPCLLLSRPAAHLLEGFQGACRDEIRRNPKSRNRSSRIGSSLRGEPGLDFSVTSGAAVLDKETNCLVSRWLASRRNGCKKCCYERQTDRYRPRSNELWRPRFLPLPSAVLCAIDGLFPRNACEASGRDCLHRVRLQQLPSPFPRIAGGRKARCPDSGRAAD